MKHSALSSMDVILLGHNSAAGACQSPDVEKDRNSSAPVQHHARSRHRGRMRPTLLEIIAEIETDPDSDEAYFLAQLRSAVTAVETPTHRLISRYRDWPSGPGRFYSN